MPTKKYFENATGSQLHELSEHCDTIRQSLRPQRNARNGI